MKTRYKIMIWIAVLVVAYVAVAIAAWRIMPYKIADAESKRPGISMALAKIANDQLAVSRRISEITKKTLDNDQDKVAQVSALMGDPTLNRMALMYMGADWSVPRSSFVGSVKHMRGLLKVQKSDREDDGNDRDADEKVSRLEMRKRQLMHGLEAPHDSAHRQKQSQWQAELNDINRQLSECRSAQRERLRKKGGSTGRGNDAKAKCEESLFKLATEYEAQTVGQLVQIMATQATSLRYDDAEPERMRRRMSCFDIWPLNKLAAMPLGNDK